MVKKLFSKFWKSSTQTRKQRKYRFNAPLHIRNKMMNSQLSKELKKEYNIRSFPSKIGDVAKITTGQFKGKEAKITRRNLKKYKIYLENTGFKRGDGTFTTYPIDPSNIIITKLNLDDKIRKARLERIKEINLKIETKEVKK